MVGSVRVMRKKAEFRIRVLEAAGRLFDEKGVEATKLDEICEAADVAKRTLSNHFPTKGDIVRALADRSIHARVAQIDSARDEGRTTRARLQIVFDRLRALPSMHVAAHHRELLGEFFLAGRGGDGVDSGELLMFDAMVALLEAGGESQLPPDCSAETFAEVVLGTISRIALEWVRRDDYDVEAHLEAAGDFLVGLLPE